jgi:hypothetical protein
MIESLLSSSDHFYSGGFMKVLRFSPPANVDDFAPGSDVAQRWHDTISDHFTEGELRVQNFLNAHSHGSRQIYNPAEHPIEATDETEKEITWNGFPKRFLGTPGSSPDYASAEPTTQPIGANREQDEYLEWFVHRNPAGKITQVDFTCEGYDYWQFLAQFAPDKVLALYQKWVSADVRREDLFKSGSYDRLNAWNTSKGAMHLTHPANNLYAEIQLASEATVRRKNAAGEVTSSSTLISCAHYGESNRNSDPKIGIECNQLARQGAMITIKDPVGLYITGIDDQGWRIKNGPPVSGGFVIRRGTPGFILRAEYRLPDTLAAQGFTVSDVQIGGDDIRFGGQIAQKITMKIVGSACQFGTLNDTPNPCGHIPQLHTAAALGVLMKPPLRSAGARQ